MYASNIVYGWTLVIRGLLRAQNHTIVEIQDGGTAAVAISNLEMKMFVSIGLFVFSHISVAQ